MNKKYAILQSVLILCVLVAMLTVSSLAWFNITAKVDDFEVQVVNSIDITVSFEIVEENGSKTPVTADNTINFENIIPGKPSKQININITNNLNEDIKLNVDFFGVNITDTITSDLELFKNNVYIDLLSPIALPDVYFSSLNGDELHLVTGFSVGAGATETISYHYAVSIAVTDVFYGKITAKGIRFTKIN